jgi:hypothetical protein
MEVVHRHIDNALPEYVCALQLSILGPKTEGLMDGVTVEQVHFTLASCYLGAI